QSYLDKHAVPSSLDDLSHHHIIAHDLTIRSSGLTFTSLSGDTRTLDFANAVLISNDYGQISGLVKEGIGVSVIPVSFTNNATLVRILPEWSARLGKISLMWPKARFIAPKIRAFIDLAVESIEPESHEDPI
ncbi:MAG: LysR substrate-binding domain-containing protein, partial [Myxococcota bacterium]